MKLAIVFALVALYIVAVASHRHHHCCHKSVHHHHKHEGKKVHHHHGHDHGHHHGHKHGHHHGHKHGHKSWGDWGGWGGHTGHSGWGGWGGHSHAHAALSHVSSIISTNISINNDTNFSCLTNRLGMVDGDGVITDIMDIMVGVMVMAGAGGKNWFNYLQLRLLTNKKS